VSRLKQGRLELCCLGRGEMFVGTIERVDRVLAIMARWAKILGIDAPRRVAVSGHVTTCTLAECAAEETSLDVGSIIAESELILTNDLETGDAS
jgi:hypothetical protein